MKAVCAVFALLSLVAGQENGEPTAVTFMPVSELPDSIIGYLRASEPSYIECVNQLTRDFPQLLKEKYQQAICVQQGIYNDTHGEFVDADYLNSLAEDFMKVLYPVADRIKRCHPDIRENCIRRAVQPLLEWAGQDYKTRSPFFADAFRFANPESREKGIIKLARAIRVADGSSAGVYYIFSLECDVAEEEFPNSRLYYKPNTTPIPDCASMKI